MAGELLRVSGLSAGADGKPILHDIDLAVGAGETHVLMGPNGAGKSTLGHVVMGDEAYEVTAGTIALDGTDVTGLSSDRRSLLGIFLSYQAPVEVPGVPLYSFLRTICQMRPELKTTARRFRERVSAAMARLDMDDSFLSRELNVGFSGGEKKKVEMLQLLLLRPRLAILDETDSGLDVDALAVVSRGMEAYRAECDGALVVITHNTRILERLDVNRAHVMVGGRIVVEGDAGLVADIDAHGFGRFEDEGAGE